MLHTNSNSPSRSSVVTELFYKFYGTGFGDALIRIPNVLLAIESENSDLMATRKPGHVDWIEKVTVCKAIDVNKYKFEGLARYLGAAIAYRTVHGSNEEEAKKVPGAVEIIATGTDILHMAFALTPRSLSGLMVLYLMDMTPSSIKKMTLDDKAVFVVFFCSCFGEKAIEGLVSSKSLKESLRVGLNVTIPMLE